jgi:NAD-dependent SIR2 family protein deacetylase
MDLAPAAARAAAALKQARALVVTAGAGMGVDSGLPDFRGDQGFWQAYPPYQRLGISFVDAANPERFEGDPALGWGFYGHRLHLYRDTVPHPGFAILRRWIEELGLEAFVITSNVDGQFQRAGFDPDRLHEVHGSIHHLQCTTPCSDLVWENLEEVPVDLETMRARRLPRCPRCGAVSRPNILMFGDWAWIADRTQAQARAFQAWLDGVGGGPLVAVELGAGTSIPTIRHATEALGDLPGATAIRINPREPAIPPPHLSLAAGALDGLRAIDAALQGERSAPRAGGSTGAP